MILLGLRAGRIGMEFSRLLGHTVPLSVSIRGKVIDVIRQGVHIMALFQ